MEQSSEDRNEVMNDFCYSLFSLGICEAKQPSSLPQVNESTLLGWPSAYT